MIIELLNSFNRLSQTSLNWFILLADGALKGGAILAFLVLFLKLGRRLRPQTRHLILLIGMIAILLIPLITRGIGALSSLQLIDSKMAPNSPAQITGPSANPQLITSLASEALIQISSPITNTSDFGFQLPHWSLWLLLLWVTGLFITSGKWLGDNIQVYRLSSVASPIRDPEWISLLDDLKAQAGIKLPVTLKSSPTIPFPLVFGWLRPVILLPDSARDWSIERRQAILLHELSHVRRYDNLSQLLATVAAIVYWFNPLVWVVLRLLKTNRELACDDQVLESGVLPSVYATHLLAVLQSLRTNSVKLKSVAALAAPNLEQRMVNILTKHDAHRKSLTKHNLLGLALIALLIVAVCSLGSLIGFAADNDSNSTGIQDPQVTIQGAQLELNLQGTIMKGSRQEFPTLWPEKGVKHKINALFGNRVNPISKKNEFHSGIDIGTPMRTPIVATGDGEVIYAEWKGEYGNYIEIKHKYLTSTYSKLDQILVHSGDKVRQGDLIAYSGKTGIATGPHLHYEIRYGETYLDPGIFTGIK
ncbi:MAG TPA: M23/M56 family metallopeptidase [Bacillota bacterium]|nr:M23/M56 family metallopeptidase [Bacillota bacterium]